MVRALASFVGSSLVVTKVTERMASRYKLFYEQEAELQQIGDAAQLAIVAKDAGMSPADTKSQMGTFIFLSPEEQKAKYFGGEGVAVSAAESLGLMFKKPGAWNVDQKISKVVTGEYLD